MQIESIAIKNYRVFKDIKIINIPQMAVFVGANGSGKSTFFDAFGFLRDSLIHNVKQAIILRGGFKELVTRGSQGPISIELKFREPSGPLATYNLSIELRDGTPVVARELLKYRRGQRGKPWHFLDFKYGKGLVVINEEEYGQPDVEEKREENELESADILAIKGLGQFQKFKVITAFRKLIEGWHVSDFHISNLKSNQEAGVAEHLSVRGDNIPLVCQYMFENHKTIFNRILEKMARRVPGISNIEPTITELGDIGLKFKESSFKEPFISKFVSDGTIKMFAYLLLLNDPNPHPLLCIEEPENQLYPHILAELAEEFRHYAQKGGQVFISTHSPEFLTACELSEVFWLAKKDGYTTIQRAQDIEILRNLINEGDKPGTLWIQGFFGGAGPQ